MAPVLKWKRYDLDKAPREWTPRRIAAAKRALIREKERAGLFGEELMRFRTVEERVARIDAEDIAFSARLRQYQAKMWKEARMLYRNLVPGIQEKVAEKWNGSRWVHHEKPTMLIGIIHSVLEEEGLATFRKPTRLPTNASMGE